MSKKRILNFLAGKLWPRTSMSWILLSTIAGGMLFNKGMHIGGVDTPSYRYALAVLCSYVLFFALIYLWLAYHFGRKSNAADHALDAVNAVDLLTIPVSLPTSTPQWEGEGGGFSGGGASGSWESAPEVLKDDALLIDGADSTSSFGKVAASAADADEGAIFVLLIALIVGVCAGGAYLVYQAPEILTEAALQAALAAGLFKKTKGIKAEGWAYPIFSRTWFIFLIVLICAALLGAAITHDCPEATSYKEYRELCR